MSFPRFLAVLSVILFGTILVVSIFKKQKGEPELATVDQVVTLEIQNEDEPVLIELEQSIKEGGEEENEPVKENEEPIKEEEEAVDRLNELFSFAGKKLPFVETITYKSKVSWLPGRSAWLCDYANHYKTSRHFIARSLNGKPDYEKQDIANGDRFNVLNPEADLSFHLLVDLDASKMLFYAVDGERDNRTLLKTYPVSVGRKDPHSSSGYLTPVGKYSLGDRVATFKPKKFAMHHGERKEMIRVFGTRWIPFEEEIEGCSDAAKGLGIHGLPWAENEEGVLAEVSSSIGQYESDGCIRLRTDDVEELYAIIITRPTIIELVNGKSGE